jgi:general secretion pathway protein K
MTCRNDGKEKGTILVTSLWIMAILSILAIGIGFRVSIEARLARYNIDRIKALYLAKAGLVKAQAVLAKHSGADSIYACGVNLDINKNETPESVFSNITLGEGSFSVGYTDNGVKRAGMSDEERKININKVGMVNTGSTPLPKGVLEELLSGYSNKTEIANAILAWREPRKDLDIDSAYDSLGYERKGGDFSAVEELLLVDGVTPEIYNSIKDYVTVHGDGQININTASERVLCAIFRSAKLVNSDTPENIAARISSSLNNLKGERWANDALPFTVVDDALRNSGVSDIDRPLVINYFTPSSNFFRIESEGTIARSGIKKKAVAVVDRRKLGDNRLLYYREY